MKVRTFIEYEHVVYNTQVQQQSSFLLEGIYSLLLAYNVFSMGGISKCRHVRKFTIFPLILESLQKMEELWSRK